MSKLTSASQLVTLLAKQRTSPQESQTPRFVGVEFACGCGEKHLATETRYFMCGGLNEFFFVCDQEYVSLVKFKGIFSVKAIKNWTCDYSLYREALDSLTN